MPVGCELELKYGFCRREVGNGFETMRCVWKLCT